MSVINELNLSRRKLLAAGGSAAIAGMGLIAASGAAAQDQEQEQEQYGIRGYEAPEIEIDYWIDGDGKASTFSVNESKGKWVFLKFFQNWCPGCHSSGFPTLKAFSDEFYGHPQVAIAAVQTVFEGDRVNNQEAVRELQLRYDIPAVMGHDPRAKDSEYPSMTMINYRTGGTPWLVLIDPNGVVAFNNFHVDSGRLIEFVKEQVA